MRVGSTTFPSPHMAHPGSGQLQFWDPVGAPTPPGGDKSSGSCPLNVRATTLGRAQEVPGDPEGRWSSRPATGRVWAGVAARVCLRFHTIKDAGRVSSSDGNSTRGRPETTHDAPALPDFFVEESWGGRRGGLGPRQPPGADSATVERRLGSAGTREGLPWPDARTRPRVGDT